ncbi:MBL fold metallo-hydrolase [Chloroflexota bacterium]
MKIKWLGHSSFLITSEDGMKIITDPFSIEVAMSYAPINETADIVTISHNHKDHNNEGVVSGNPQSIKGEGTKRIKGIDFRGIDSHHDAEGGNLRGSNVIFCFCVDGINICHLGDLGHVLNPKQIPDIGLVDILLIPVGGYYTIDHKQATAISQTLKPRIIIPMHYKNSKCNYPITEVEEFLRDKNNVRRFDLNEVDYKKSELPETTEIVILQPV